MIDTPAHAVIDDLAGVLLIGVPWLFGFAALIWWPLVRGGWAEIVVPPMTRREHDTLP